jgi:NADH pyrophosphatase NudC (nudix superfamily)
MIGCFAHALKEEINIDRKEIADARWFTPQEIDQGKPAIRRSRARWTHH